MSAAANPWTFNAYNSNDCTGDPDQFRGQQLSIECSPLGRSTYSALLWNFQACAIYFFDTKEDCEHQGRAAGAWYEGLLPRPPGNPIESAGGFTLKKIEMFSRPATYYSVSCQIGRKPAQPARPQPVEPQVNLPPPSGYLRPNFSR